MLIVILKRVRRQLILLLTVTLVLIAAYVSIGRQFMPAISRYTQFFEQQIFELSGVPVAVDSLVGSFQGFNPVIQVNGLRLLVDAAPSSSALVFDNASVIVDIPRSIRQRSWVLEDFVVEELELNVEQTESGSWQLGGLNTSGEGGVDLNNLYRTFLRFSQLSLRDVTVNLQTFMGDRVSFNNGSATIENRGQNHYLHANVSLEGNDQQVAFSFEVEGDDLADIEGKLHLDFPEDDYSVLFRGQEFGGTTVQQFFGGGDLWLAFSGGQINETVSQLDVDSVTFGSTTSEPLRLDNISGKSRLTIVAEENYWELALADMSVSWQELAWSPFNAYLQVFPEQLLSARADNINISLLAQIATNSGLLSANAQQQIEMYSPRGALQNFSFTMPLAENSEENLRVKTNLLSADVASVRGSPNMWGINGYAELEIDSDSRQALGLFEVESEEFRINLPNVFQNTWDYNYVNGSMAFRRDLDNELELRLLSSMIVANSDAVDARVQFSSIINDPASSEPKAELELLVGALRFDAQQKALYLPDAPTIDPGLKNVMEWLNQAILDGTVSNSAALYRGSTLPGAPSETKTFQSYYLMTDGELNFSDEWPNLSDVSAYVATDDGNVDIEVASSNSMNIGAGSVLADIRQDAESRTNLSVRGQASGSTADGLNYLQSAAVGENLKSAFANWQADGDFSADIEVIVPLGGPESSPVLETDVRLDITLVDNKLVIPDYAIEVEELNGPVVFDTRTGLEPSELRGRLFGQLASLKLSSELKSGELETIFVDATGSVDPEQLIAWPLQEEFVRDLLRKMEGQLAYEAKLSITQALGSEVSNRLSIDSSLIGASLALPDPFGKSVEMELPLHLDMDFADNSQHVFGTLGPALSFDLELEQGSIRDGLVFVGDSQSSFEGLLMNDTDGLAVLGSMEHFKFDQWSSFLAELNEDGSASSELGGAIEFVDLQLDVLELYDQQLDDVNMRIVGDLTERQWAVTLNSESLAGRVNLPFASDDYIELDLDYLRLPGGEADRIGPPEEQTLQQLEAAEEERVDVLAQIDPSELPRLKFSADEFRIGDRSYGSWNFTLTPNSTGAEITDMMFDFRGLRLGMDGLVAADEATGATQPHFNWRYDGVEHHSELLGVLYADNVADVLTANGYAPSLESDRAVFTTDINWSGSPAFFSAANLSGDIGIEVRDGRFLQGSGAAGALKLVSILNFDAIMRRLRFSDDLLYSGLAYDEISAQLSLSNGLVNIEDQLVIEGPSSLYQITGEVDLVNETISGEMYLTLPVSENIPWLGLLTANLPLAVGAYLFDRIFGNQVNTLTSAVYTLEGPWEGLEPEFKQAFGSPDTEQ